MSKTRASNYGRRKNNPFSTSTFKLEGLSQFDLSHTIAYDTDFGDLRPIASFDNILGQRTRCNLAYVLNMDPLRKPLYSGISVTYDAVYVSDQLVGYDSQKWFNPVTTQEERDAAKQPFANAGLLLYAYYNRFLTRGDTMTSVGDTTFPDKCVRPIYNTLYDAFGYPFRSDIYDYLDMSSTTWSGFGVTNSTYQTLDQLLNPLSAFYESHKTAVEPYDAIVPYPNLITDGSVWCQPDMFVTSVRFFNGVDYIDVDSDGLVSTAPFPDSAGYSNFISVRSLADGNHFIGLSTTYRQEGTPFLSFYRWLVCSCVRPDDFSVSISGGRFVLAGLLRESNVSLGSWLSGGLSEYLHPGISTTDATLADLDWDRLCRKLGWSSYQECLDAYRSYVYSVLAVSFANELVDLRPIFAYRRAYNDLYVNTNLWDCELFSEGSIDEYFNLPDDSGLFGTSFSLTQIAVSPANASYSSLLFDLGLLKRWWSNDMFTSAVPADMSAAANAVEIPSSGVTLVDLRNLNIMQEVQERENYAGQRVTDTTFAFFGFKSPELNYYYARHISRITDSPTIQNVLQNSETAETPQANPAGYGTGAKSARFFDFQNPWYGFILILSSVMTEPVYKDAVSRMILKKDYEDFLFPPYQEISDISVAKSEVQAGVSGVLGFQRSYYYYMRMNHRLSGTMRLRQKEEWNTARDFRDGFALNADFAMPNSSDRLNRIFADQSDGINHFNFFVGLDVQTILPLKRDIHYHL